MKVPRVQLEMERPIFKFVEIINDSIDRTCKYSQPSVFKQLASQLKLFNTQAKT